MVVEIPVKPYVRHFLRKHFDKEPIFIRSDSELGQTLFLGLGTREYLRRCFDHNGALPALPEVVETLEDDKTLVIPENMVLVKLEFPQKYDRAIMLPDTLIEMGSVLEAFVRIYLLGFAQGYKCMFYSDHAAAEAFLRVFGFKENELSKENCHKIIQRGGAIKFKDLLKGKEKRRKNIKYVSA